MGTKPLRIGVLCDDLRLTAWQVECLQRILDSGDCEIALFVINDNPPEPPRPFIDKLRRNLTNGLLIWRIYERLVLGRAVSSRPVALPVRLAHVPLLHCKPLKIGRFRQALDEITIERLRACELDVLVRFGFGILTGEVLSAARYGIWSYHHGDPYEFRGAPPGFWEIHNGSPATGVVLQRLTESLDGGVILRSGRFKTIESSYRRSLDRVYFGAAGFIAASLRELRRNPEAFANSGPLQRPGPIYRYPKNAAMLRFLARSWGSWVRDQFRSLFRHQQWSLGLIRMPVAELVERATAGKNDLPAVEWLPEERAYFLADPMVAGEDGNLTVFAEQFDWLSGLGHIVQVKGFGSSGSTIAIRSDQHLSYPYLVEDAGALYCIPECSESRRVTLYQLDDATGRWEERKVLIDDFAAVDPTLFHFSDRWWLFCTNGEVGANEFLHAWHAHDLLGEWERHAVNPIKIDIGSARPAGKPFKYNDHLIRPAQDCSKRYGGSLVFNRIVRLTPDEFAEEPVTRLEPDGGGPYPAGLHTVSSAGGITVIDGARYVFRPAEMWRTLSRKLRLGRGA
jgi:hypothetical protein